MSDNDKDDKEIPSSGNKGMIGRGALQALSGAIPFAGGLFSAAAGYWSEKEEAKANEFLRSWIKMLEEELREKQQTILEILARLDMHDEKIRDRISSKEYQTLSKKAFRDWSAAESEYKRKCVRNTLAHAATTSMCSDNVVHLFLEWLEKYQEFHFRVIAEIYRNQNGITRGQIWHNLGMQKVREDSADADLFKLLIRDLSTGGIVRQHRETDYYGNFVPKQHSRSKSTGQGKAYTSAFDDSEQYELTELGRQFVHYAMTDVPIKISFHEEKVEEPV